MHCVESMHSTSSVLSTTVFAGDKIATVERRAFTAATVDSDSIFLVKQRLNVLYTTSGQSDNTKDFYQRVTTRGYRGLEFKPVWSSER